MDSAKSNTTFENFKVENITCENIPVPSFLNKSEYCTESVHFECPVYPCFLDTIEVTVSILGLILNLCMTLAFIQIGRNLKPRHLFLLSLAINDMAVAGFHVIRPFYNFQTVFANRFRYVPFPYTFDVSAVIGMAYTYVQFAAIANVLIITLDVFLAVTAPLFHRKINTKSTASILVGLAWILSLMLYVSPFLSDFRIHKLYIVYNGLSIFCIAVLAIFYLILLLKLRSLKLPENRSSSKATGTVVAILLTFMFFMLPGFWLSVVLRRVIVRKGVFTWKLWFTTLQSYQCLCVLNTVCDPVIYILRIDEIRYLFKIAFYKFLNCVRRGRASDRNHRMTSSRDGQFSNIGSRSTDKTVENTSQ